jgi:hypothetical protein
LGYNDSPPGIALGAPLLLYGAKMFRNDDNDDDDDDDVEISVEDELAVGLDDKTFTASLRRSVTLLIFAMIYPETGEKDT